ncbi:MAG: ATP-grasp domain-containing protein [Desulfobacterales bacterium]|nr:ATP-grasp domain-containing protein [Desulfobacterales bacterium]
MTSIYFSNYQVEEDTDYFLYIGELKNYGLNHFLKDALSKFYHRKFKFIAIVPDIAEQYNYDNVIVINPLVNDYKCRYGSHVNCRVSAAEFMATVSKTREIQCLIEQILRRQDHLFLYMYESLEEMTLDEIPGVSILGPDKTIAREVNNKVVQLTQLKEIVPLVEHEILRGGKALLETTAGLWNQWDQGIFVTRPFSAAGINSVVAQSNGEIQTKFDLGGEDAEPETEFIISRYMPHDLDPTVLAVVAGEDDIYIAGIADQRISHGNRFTGSTFPSAANAEQRQLLREHTRAVGKWLAQQGYRGIFGCDYIITHDGEIYFLEINARKQGTTLEFCCTLEQGLPHQAPNLPELEFFAVTQEIFPANTCELDHGSIPLHWGTYNYKIEDPVKTSTYIPQASGEREAFARVSKRNLKKDFLILEHTGSDFVIAQGAFIGRIVALGQDLESVTQGISQGCKTIELTFSQSQNESN